MDLQALAPQQLLHPADDPRGIGHGDGQRGEGDAVQSAHEPVEHQLQHDEQHGGHGAHRVHPRAEGHADAGGGPDACGGGQPPDGAAPDEDDPRPQKADARHHGRGHPGGIKAAAPSRRIGEAVFGHLHHQSGAKGHHRVGADAGLLQPDGALGAHGRPAQAGQHHTQKKHQLLCHRISFLKRWSVR